MAGLTEAKEKARQLQNSGKYDEAIKIYMKIIAATKMNPDPSFYNTIGDIYLNNLKKTGEGVENYKAAMNLYVTQAWYSNAIVMAKKIIKVDPSILEMYENVAEFYKKSGSLGEALNSYILLAERAIQGNNRQMAIEAFKKTLELMPEKVEIKEKLVELYLQENNLEFALEFLKEIESFYIKRSDLSQASMTRKKIQQIESKLGRSAREEPQKIEIKEEIIPEAPPQVHAEESMDIDINDLTMDLTKQLDETFTQSFYEEKTDKIENNAQINQYTASNSDSQFEKSQTGSESEIDGLFKEDASSFGSFVELGKLQEDIDVSGAVQSYYQGADGYLENKDYDNAQNVYKRIFEIKPDEDRACKKIIEIANLTKHYNDAVNPYVHLAKNVMEKSPLDAMNYIENALKIAPTYQIAIQLKQELMGKLNQNKIQPDPFYHESAQKETQAPQQQKAQSFSQEDPFAKQRMAQQPKPDVQPIKHEEVPIQNPFTQNQASNQSFERFAPTPPPAKEDIQSNPLDDFSREILGEMGNMDLFKEQDHLTAKDIMQGKNEGNKPKFKIEGNDPVSQDQGVWSLQELLDELKEGLDQNIDEGDVSSHYDLGLSFKEMGLYDMAVEEFQKAVKHKDYEMKSLEMLGQCFLEKGDFDLAEGSLTKALSTKGRNEVEYFGIKFTLAKLYEKKEMIKEALKIYNEIYAVDSKFEDVEKRITALKNAHKEPEKPIKKEEKSSDFIDFSAILKDEISGDLNFDDLDIDNMTIELTDEEKENLAKKNNKVSYM